MQRSRSLLCAAALASAGACLLFARSRAGLMGVNYVCAANLSKLETGVVMYAQDYDEIFPPTKRPGAFRADVFPYVRTKTVFLCPATALLYTPNSALDSQTLAQFPDRGST